MDSDRWGLASSTGGLVAAFASQIPASDGLMVVAYAMAGVGAWLLVRDRAAAWVGLAGSVLLAALGFLVLLRQKLVVGFRGEKLAQLGVVLEAPVWDAVLVLAPFVVVAVALVLRARGWGRRSAGLSLALAGVTVLLATRLVPAVAIGGNVVGGALVFVLVPLLAALVSLGLDLRGAKISRTGTSTG